MSLVDEASQNYFRIAYKYVHKSIRRPSKRIESAPVIYWFGWSETNRYTQAPIR
jgi:hypothetical protein